MILWCVDTAVLDAVFYSRQQYGYYDSLPSACVLLGRAVDGGVQKTDPHGKYRYHSATWTEDLCSVWQECVPSVAGAGSLLGVGMKNRALAGSEGWSQLGAWPPGVMRHRQAAERGSPHFPAAPSPRFLLLALKLLPCFHACTAPGASPHLAFARIVALVSRACSMCA